MMTRALTLLDVIWWDHRTLTCRLIERLRPGTGHKWDTHSDPPACTWCGRTRP